MPEAADAITTKGGHLTHAIKIINVNIHRHVGDVPSIEGFQCALALRGEDAHEVLEDALPDTQLKLVH